MTAESSPDQPQSGPDVAAWKGIVVQYQEPSTGRALWQVFNTLGPYALLWYLMYLSMAVSWWIVVPLAALSGAFLVRVFIIFHDCGHGSFFKTKNANDLTGFIMGMLVFTPYYHWRWEHAIHHATSGHLDKRGVGDIWTMTVQEYLQSSRWKRLAYRLVRNPILLFCIAPAYLFIFWQRIPAKQASPRERRSVHWMNFALLGWTALLSWIFGFQSYLLIQLIAMVVSGSAGVWMFYVQHQFEDSYWARGQEWDYTTAALQGSSYYKLPKILQWFSGNIGFHHIHHLSSRIPNYNLERCHRSHPIFQQVTPITLLSSLKTIRLRLWDEELQQLVGYSRLRQLRREQKGIRPAA